jgi:hypothetical protein
MYTTYHGSTSFRHPWTQQSNIDPQNKTKNLNSVSIFVCVVYVGSIETKTLTKYSIDDTLQGG